MNLFPAFVRYGNCFDGGFGYLARAMSQLFRIHPDNPQARLVKQAADIVRAGGVIVYPTDTAYAIGCHTARRDLRIRARTEASRTSA